MNVPIHLFIVVLGNVHISTHVSTSMFSKKTLYSDIHLFKDPHIHAPIVSQSIDWCVLQCHTTTESSSLQFHIPTFLIIIRLSLKEHVKEQKKTEKVEKQSHAHRTRQNSKNNRNKQRKEH